MTVKELKDLLNKTDDLDDCTISIDWHENGAVCSRTDFIPNVEWLGPGELGVSLACDPNKPSSELEIGVKLAEFDMQEYFEEA